MPTATDILSGLTRIANDWWRLAAVWHGLVAVLIGAIVLRWRPPRRVAALLLTLPLASVATMAGISGHPVNSLVFAALAAGLTAVAITLPGEPVRLAPRIDVAAGAVLVMVGWCYPHVLAGGSWLAYAYATPRGVIPCPTLAAVVGLSVAFGSFRSRAWALTLAAAGAAYGLIGLLVLNVGIDVMLLGGSLWLLRQRR